MAAEEMRLMRTYRSHLSLLFLIAVAAVAGAEAQTAGALQMPTVDDIVAMNLKARGGVELLRSTESMKMSGTVTLPGGQGKLTVWMKRPDRKRTEMELGGKKTVEAYDGTTPWIRMGDMPAQVIPSTPQLDEAKGRSELDPVLLDYKERGRSVTLIGREKSGGADVFHLRLQRRGFDYYIDTVTGLDKRMSNSDSPDGMMRRRCLRFSDYRDVRGWFLCGSAVVDGRRSRTDQSRSVEFNVPIEDGMFKMPAKG
jgi:hypothetical protein